MGISPPQGFLATEIASSSVETGDIANDAVTRAKVAASAIGSVEIDAGAVDTAEIAGSAVTGEKIADDAVTTRTVSAGAIGSAEVADSAIAAGDLATDAVTSRTVSAGAVGTAEIATSAVTATEIAADAVGPAELDESGQFSAAGLSVGGLLMRGTADINDNPLLGVRTSPSAVSGADISVGEVIIDEAQNRLAWKESTGSAFAVSGVAIN